MKILAIDTATPVCSVALTQGEALVAEYRLSRKNSHNEKLVVTIQRLLSDAGWSPADLGGIVCSLGPGSFTGLRIGLSAAKGLAFARGIPLAGVKTPDAFAHSARLWRGQVCVAIKARAEEAYFALYRAEEQTVQMVSDCQVVSIDEISDRLQEKTLVLTSPAELLSRIHGPHAVAPPPGLLAPYPVALAQLGAEKLQRHETLDLAAAEPFYIKTFKPRRKAYHAD